MVLLESPSMIQIYCTTPQPGILIRRLGDIRHLPVCAELVAMDV